MDSLDFGAASCADAVADFYWLWSRQCRYYERLASALQMQDLQHRLLTAEVAVESKATQTDEPFPAEADLKDPSLP